MKVYKNYNNYIEDFEEFKSNMLETDLQKLIDSYVMSLYYDILDYTNGDDEETPEFVIEKIENTIKEYYANI